MTSVVLRNIISVPIAGHAPSTQLYWDWRLWARADGGENVSLIKFNPPAPKGATYTASTLRLVERLNVPDNVVLYLSKITGPWDASKVTWNTAPPATPVGRVTGIRSTVPNPDGGTMRVVDFPIQTLLNDYSQGTEPFYGFWLSTPTPGGYWEFVDARVGGGKAPKVTIEWSDKPSQPKELSPRGGQHSGLANPFFTFDFKDYGGGVEMQAFRLQVAPGGSTFSPSFDTGTVPSSTPQYNSSGSSLDLTEGAEYQWRVMVQDNEGLWSSWSAPAVFRWSARGSLSIVSPADAPNNIIEDPTPTVSWDFASGSRTQRAYHVLVNDMSTGARVYDSGMLSSSSEVHTVANPNQTPVFSDEGTYELIVRSYDDLVRPNTPNERPYLEDRQVFTFQSTDSITPPASLAAHQLSPGSPLVRLIWSRTTTPDRFMILRDGQVISAAANAEAYRVDATTYEFIDVYSTPRTPHVWEVRAISDGESGGISTEAEFAPPTAFLTVLNNDNSLAASVSLLEYGVDVSSTDGSEIIVPLNSPTPLTIFQGSGVGRYGEANGILSNSTTPGVSSQEMRDVLLSLQTEAGRGRPCVLTYADQSIPCVVSRIGVAPKVFNEEIVYQATFSFSERGL